MDPKQLLRWAGPKSGASLALGATEKTSNPLLSSSSVAGSETQILSFQSSVEELQKWACELQTRKGTSGHTVQQFSQEEQLAQGPRALGGSRTRDSFPHPAASLGEQTQKRHSCSKRAPVTGEVGEPGAGGAAPSSPVHCFLPQPRGTKQPQGGQWGGAGLTARVSTLQEVGHMCEESLPCPPRRGVGPGREVGGRPPEKGRSQLSLEGRDRGAGAPLMGSSTGEPWVMKMCCLGRPWLWAAQTRPGLWTLPLWWPRSGGLMPHPPPADRDCQEGHCGHVLHGHTEGLLLDGLTVFQLLTCRRRASLVAQW